jgi:hypothetical protein
VTLARSPGRALKPLMQQAFPALRAEVHVFLPLVSFELTMTPHPRACSNHRCRNKERDLSLAYFRKGNSEHECYIYHKQCNDCRQTPTQPCSDSTVLLLAL